MDITTQAISDCEREGRDAFRNHGVTGETRHSFPPGSIQRMGFLSGFSEAKAAAADRACDEALAYHQLSVRDNVLDRKIANRLAAERSATA
jgi:hypothetical protein